ncbi:MAG: malate synthase G [Dermatophilaceae bacterium]
MGADYVDVAGMRVSAPLRAFVEDEALPGTGVTPEAFWSGLAAAVATLAPRIEAALAERARIQAVLDDYHRAHPGQPDPAAYQVLLREVGYLVDEPDVVSLTTTAVDPEVATVAGPQLVVPVTNARFAVNAANARWGSLYDALYGTDAIPEADGCERGAAYNPRRGAAVVAFGRQFLDETFPLSAGSHREVVWYAADGAGLLARLTDGSTARLAEPSAFVGSVGEPAAPQRVVLVHHGLHVEIHLDRTHPIGATDPAGVADLVLESAVTTIADCEDSVATVDPADKIGAYRNWLGLMTGTLTAPVVKDGRTVTRALAPDRVVRTVDGGSVRLPGRSVLFVRTVGHHLSTDAVLDASGAPIPEGILDAFVTALAGVHDLRGPAAGANSRTGSIYLVKPKQHGPAEVALTCELFAAVERVLGLPTGTVKLGLMDEERRTSVNLAACIAVAADRLVFVNTGFLDRTGDEIRTSTYAGPMVRKGDMKRATWLAAYEDWNVDVALACGLAGRAQIGKGMWAAPDSMAAMLVEKVTHPLAGASTAWVPSPTAATLHALHYHQVDVAARQRALASGEARARARREDLLVVPLGEPGDWSAQQRRHELDLNLQSALGYVVRWVDQGVGCSKVPDLGGTALMEDRATCRISSQHVANWLLHGVVSPEQVEAGLRRMAAVVDGQNAGDPAYRPMAPACDGPAFAAVRELVVDGLGQPQGYTEFVLAHWRRAAKTRRAGLGSSEQTL